MRNLLGLLLVKFLLAWLLIQSDILGLAPDEAQYWTWSQNLDWGYYSKPPGIAWEIAFGTALFGNTTFGLRFGALLLGVAIPAALYRLTRQAGLSSAAALSSAIAFSFCPLGVLGGWLATTDGGMILFWTLATGVFVRALRLEQAPDYTSIGLLIGFGALFKWTTFLLWPILLLWTPWTPNDKSSYRAMLRGVFLSLLALLPSLYWNWHHDWATFRHVWGNMSGGPSGSSAPKAPGNFFEWIGAQFALVSPILLVFVILGCVSAVRPWKACPAPIRFCAACTLLILSGIGGMALFQRMQGNWAVYAYPTGFAAMAWYVHAHFRRPRLGIALGCAVSIILMFSIAIIPWFQSSGTTIAGWRIPCKINPFKHYVGWHRLSEVLSKVGYEADQHFLFADNYQMTSVLSFYADGQQRAYFFNRGGKRRNQFSYWPSMVEEQTGRTGFFTTGGNPEQSEKLLSELSEYFEDVTLAASDSLFFCYGQPVKSILVFRCSGFVGKEPASPHVF